MGPGRLSQLPRDGQRDTGGFAGSQHCPPSPTSQSCGQLSRQGKAGQAAWAWGSHSQSCLGLAGTSVGCGMNWDSFTPPCMTMPGPVPPAPREASGDGEGTVVWDRFWEAEPASPAPCQPCVPPTHAGPSPANTSTKIPSLAPGWGTSKPHHHCRTAETEVCKESQGHALDPLPQGSASHPLRREQLHVPGGAPHPDLPGWDHSDPCGDFNEGIFSCRGPWCYPRRGSSRSRIFPR